MMKRIKFEYSDIDGGNVQMEAVYTGPERNPLETVDPVSLSLIRHACPNLDWEYDNGICRIRGKLLTSSCKTAGAVV